MPRLRARSSPIPVLVLLAAVLVPYGCAGGEEGQPPASVPAGTPLEVADEPGLSVGVVRGVRTEQFHDVLTPFLHRDSLLAVPLRGAGAIRVFGPDGDLVRSLGGPGEGPGEFRRLGGAWPRGDTVEAFDAKLGRVTRFTPAGSTEVVRLESGPPAQGAAPGPVPDGWALYGVESAGMGRRDTVAVHRFGRDGSHRGRIARVAGFSRYRTDFGGGPDPLSPKAVFAVHDARVYVAETLTPRIRVLSPGGEPRREITWDPGGLPPAEEAFATVVDTAVARAEPDRREPLRRRLESFPVRDRVPAFWDVIVDDEGFVWVQEYDPATQSPVHGDARGAGPGGEWLILTPEGRRAGSVAMPDGLRPTRITRDDVVGIHRNELGVETVRVHSLRRRSN